MGLKVPFSGLGTVNILEKYNGSGSSISLTYPLSSHSGSMGRILPVWTGPVLTSGGTVRDRGGGDEKVNFRPSQNIIAATGSPRAAHF